LGDSIFCGAVGGGGPATAAAMAIVASAFNSDRPKLCG
jgi:hypothetical protein